MTQEPYVYCFDIDGTVCSLTDGDYDLAEPYPERIFHINELYRDGHTIKMFTARGSTTGIDWREVTARQLNDWGVLYHELILGKPFANFYVDDRAIAADSYPW